MESSLRYILHSEDAEPDNLRADAPASHQQQELSPDDSAATAATASRKRQQPRAKVSYPRKRAVKACRTCRLRRTKCDNEHPSCTSCLDLGVECNYQPGDPSTFDPASLAILQRLDGLEDLLRGRLTEPSPLEEAKTVQTPASLQRNLDSPALERTADSIPCYINIEAVLAWPVFDEQSFGPHLDLRSLLQANDNRSDPPLMSVSSDFDLYAAPQLLQQFLENVHIFNPVLEEAKVKEYMLEARFNGLGWDARSCLLVNIEIRNSDQEADFTKLLIYAIGSISLPFEKTPTGTSSTFRQSKEFQQAESYFFAAQKRMGMLLCGSGVVEAQCFFLAGVYLMATIRPIEAWKMFVQALACCQGFYSHRKPHHLHEEERQLQQSVYWSVFKSELELRLELNVSEKSVWDLTYPAFFPSPPKGLKSQGEPVWYFYLAEIALRRLGNRILNHIYQNGSTAASSSEIDDAIPNFEDQADGWLGSLPPALKLDTVDAFDKTREHTALRFILNGHLLDCYEMMYWPSIVDGIHGRLRGGSHDAFARKGLRVCVQRIDQNESGFYHRHHGTWLMLRSCTRSALVLLGAVRSPQLSPLLPNGWERSIQQVMAMLTFWKDESQDVKDRLQVLEALMAGLTPRSR